MNIKDLKDSLKYVFAAEVTPFVWGHAGIGKSTVFKQYAQEMGYKFFPFYLGTQSDLGDILGLASFVKDENGSEIATTFATPVWLKDTIDYCNANPDSGAIILLDEFNRARRDILNGMFSLALDKTFHTMKLPKNCHIIAAGNPPTDDYITTDVNETALMARFVHVKLEPTVKEWTDYATAANFDRRVLSFINEQPELLEEKRQEFQLPVKVDRRAWERLQRLTTVNTPAHLWDQLAAGIIGYERLVAFKLHLEKTEQPLTGYQVLSGEGFDRIKVWAEPANVQASYLSATNDNVYATLEEVAKAGAETLNDVMAEHLIAYIEALPKELAYVFMQKLMVPAPKNPCYQLFRSIQTGNPSHNKRLVAVMAEAKNVKIEEKEAA